MKRAQILLISTYTELTMQAKKIAKELNIPIDIYEGGILNNGHIYATSKADLYDVIISISGTAEIIKKLVTTVPVLSIETTSGDILRALGQAIRFNKRKISAFILFFKTRIRITDFTCNGLA